MRRRLQVAQGLHKAAGVVALVAAHGDPSVAQTRDETRRGVAFAGAGRRHDARVDHQSVAVLHQDLAEIGQLEPVHAFQRRECDRFQRQPFAGLSRVWCILVQDGVT